MICYQCRSAVIVSLYVNDFLKYGKILINYEVYLMEFEIREATITDAEEIYILNRDEMGYEFSIEQTREKLIKLFSSGNDKIFVAISENKVVGYAHANDYDVIYAPHMKNIMGIAVSKDYKHNGIGTALLQAVEGWAKQTGASGVRLVSGESRTGAHEFYRSCGYEGEKKQINFKKIFKED